MSDQQIKGQRGSTLIEVLVSIVIISFGLLGVAALQVVGLKNNHSSMQRSQATVLAFDLLDRMRVNRKQTKDGAYDSDGSASAGSAISATPGGASGMAKVDLDDWFVLLGKRLPAASAIIEANANANVIRITIRWDDTRGTGGGATQSFSVEAQGCGTGTSCTL